MRKLIYAVGTIAILSAAFVFVQRAIPQSNQPKITWLPSSVYAGITGTHTVTKTVTFTSDHGLQGVVVEAVPQIAGFVKIQPTTFAQVSSATLQTVQLTFSAPAGAQFGVYDGTIHFRVGNATLPQTLKASVTFAVVPLPPDPGLTGMATIAGIDSDGDGVRDDVERSIALTYPNSARVRGALYQLARAEQQVILSTTSTQSVASDAVDRSAECLNQTNQLLHFSPNVVYTISQTLIAQMLNTDARISAALAAGDRDNGRTGSLMTMGEKLRTNFCDVDPSRLEN